MDLDISDTAHYSGGALLLVVSCLSLTWFTLTWLRAEIRMGEIPYTSVLKITYTRLLVAWIIAGLAVGLGRLIWFPVFPMVIAVEDYGRHCATIPEGTAGFLDCQLRLGRARSWVEWYTQFGQWPANILNLFVSLGSVMAAWVLVKSWLGKYSLPVILAMSVIIYLIGIILSEWLATWIV